MNSSLETSTEINLNITAVTEEEKTSLKETVTENVENILFDITNLTEESQYNNSNLNGTFSNGCFRRGPKFSKSSNKNPILVKSGFYLSK